MPDKSKENHLVAQTVSTSFSGPLPPPAILFGTFLILKTGNPVAGGLLSVGSIATLAGVFIYGSRQRAQERLRREEFRKNVITSRS